MRSRASTLASSPSKRARKLAWVPVVPFTPRNRKLGDPALDLAKVEDQLVAPERRPLAHGHELRRLEVGVAQARQVLPAAGEVGEGVDGRDEPVADQWSASRIRIRSALSVT